MRNLLTPRLTFTAILASGAFAACADRNTEQDKLGVARQAEEVEDQDGDSDEKNRDEGAVDDHQDPTQNCRQFFVDNPDERDRDRAAHGHGDQSEKREGEGRDRLELEQRGQCGDDVERGSNAFFDRKLKGLGGNGRSCADCHMLSDNFQLSPGKAKARFDALMALRAEDPDADDPLFRPIDADDFRTNGTSARRREERSDRLPALALSPTSFPWR